MYGFRQFIDYANTNKDLVDTYLNSPNMDISEIAKNFGKSVAEVYRILRSHNIQPNRLKKHHERVHSFHHLGYTPKEIAEFTGYTPRNVRYVLAKNRNQK